MKNLDISVVGMSYRVTPSTMQKIAGAVPLKATLVREPDNLHDPNAIAVYLADKPWKNFHIGYVPRGIAADIAPRLDKGTLKIVNVTLHTVDLVEAVGEMTVKARKVKSPAKR